MLYKLSEERYFKDLALPLLHKKEKKKDMIYIPVKGR